MRKAFVMRGQTESTSGLNTEILNFGKYKTGYAYRLTEFLLYPSINIGSTIHELCASITAGKTAVDPQAVNFNDDGLIGSAMFTNGPGNVHNQEHYSVINDTFMVTQNLILKVHDSGGSGHPVNWQCRFESVKMTGPEEAAVNYKQFAISDE